MHTIFMNSENSKTFDHHRLIFNLLDKITLKSVINMLHHETLIFNTHGKYIKRSHNKNKFKHLLQHGMMNLNNLMDHILYQKFKIVLSISSKTMKH